MFISTLIVQLQNLYGNAMMQKLPKSDFRWIGENEINQFDIDTVDLEGDLGYIIECDLKYPQKSITIQAIV